MATVEWQEDRPEARGDLRDRIHGVGLGVERAHRNGQNGDQADRQDGRPGEETV